MPLLLAVPCPPNLYIDLVILRHVRNHRRLLRGNRQHLAGFLRYNINLNHQLCNIILMVDRDVTTPKPNLSLYSPYYTEACGELAVPIYVS